MEESDSKQRDAQALLNMSRPGRVRHSPKRSAGIQTNVTAFLKSAMPQKKITQETDITFYSPKPETEIIDSGEEDGRINLNSGRSDKEMKWEIAYAQTDKAASVLETVKIGAYDAQKYTDTLEEYCKESTAAAKYIRNTVEKLATAIRHIYNDAARESENIKKGLKVLGKIHEEETQDNAKYRAEVATTRKVLEQNAMVIANMVRESEGKEMKKKSRPRDSPTPPTGAQRRKMARRLEPDLTETTDATDKEETADTEEWKEANNRKRPRRNKRDAPVSTKMIEKPSYAQAIKKTEADRQPNLSKRPPQATITIKTNSKLSFAEAMQKIKRQTCLQEVEVTAARKTAAGFLLLQFGKGTETEKVDEIKNKIAKAMGEEISVIQTTKKLVIQVSDIDPVTDMAEVEEKVAQELPGEEIKILPLKAGFGGMQRTIVTVNDTPKARQLVDKGRLKIGFVSCRIKVMPTATRCYRCHNLGHTAARCTLDKGIKEICRKCGEKDHTINECTNKARCLICVNNGFPDNQVGHVAASIGCPSVRLYKPT